jgi:hypothetical protein
MRLVENAPQYSSGGMTRITFGWRLYNLHETADVCGQDRLEIGSVTPSFYLRNRLTSRLCIARKLWFFVEGTYSSCLWPVHAGCIAVSQVYMLDVDCGTGPVVILAESSRHPMISLDLDQDSQVDSRRLPLLYSNYNVLQQCITWNVLQLYYIESITYIELDRGKQSSSCHPILSSIPFNVN